MNDEIKEILDYLKKRKEFFNKQDGYLSFSYKYCDKLLDYITNLQEKNERLKKEKKKLSNDLAEAILFNQKRCEQNKELKQRIGKANEYIKEKTTHYTSYLPPVPKEVPKLELQREAYDKLLNILNGGDE